MSALKRTLRRLAPGAYDRIVGFRQHRRTQRVLKERGIPQLVERWVQQHGWIVSQGPLKDLKYIESADGSVLLPKLMGSYERELHGVLDQILESAFEKIVDIGCAEGYYAIGLAVKLPRVKVLAYDLAPRARENCRSMAVLNQVASRVEIHGLCDHQQLRHHAAASTLLICDCEGGEWMLLDPVAVEGLSEVSMLVELHADGGNGETTESVRSRFSDRFASTHRIEFISAIPRTGDEVGQASSWTDSDRKLALDEMRIRGLTWAWAIPHSVGD